MNDDIIQKIGEIFEYYAEVLGDSWSWMAGLLLTPLAIGALLHFTRKKSPRALPPPLSSVLGYGLLLVSLTAAVWLALEQASVVDDAFISFRYARHLVEGHGLVFNPGEYVEGYTNFLWTLLVAFGIAVTPFEAPIVALGLGVSAMVANIVTVFFIGRQCARERGLPLYIPFAACLLAIQHTAVEFGTTGLETTFASLLVNLGLLFLVVQQSIRSCMLSGTFFILAALTRPDHGLFFIAGGLSVALPLLKPLFAARKQGVATMWQEGLRELASYSAPFLVYLLYLGWKLSYYGSILPNTYYAKSADSFYLQQGLIYATTFYLGSHFLLLLPLLFVWLFWPNRGRSARLKVFIGSSFIFYNFYIFKIGGDFMYGRFYLSLIPLVLLAVQDFAFLLRTEGAAMISPHRCWASLIVIGLLICTAQGERIIGPDKWRWGIANEGEFYRVDQFDPMVIDNYNQGIGQFFGKVFYDRDIRPVIATGGIGMVGYYSHLDLIDQVGLTDRFVARMKLGQRGRPGHERFATMEYLRKRGVVFARFNQRQGFPRRYRKIAQLNIPFRRVSGRYWYIISYKSELMDTIRQKCPEVRFTHFERYLDRYIRNVNSKGRRDVRRDLEWFDEYYFDHNEDRTRRNAIVSFLRSLE